MGSRRWDDALDFQTAMASAPDQALLSLLLNSIYALDRLNKPPALVKAGRGVDSDRAAGQNSGGNRPMVPAGGRGVWRRPRSCRSLR